MLIALGTVSIISVLSSRVYVSVASSVVLLAVDTAAKIFRIYGNVLLHEDKIYVSSM